MAYRTWQMRRNTAALAAASNPVLAAGEPGFETDTGKIKIGNGTRTWNTLPAYDPASQIPSLLNRVLSITDATGNALEIYQVWIPYFLSEGFSQANLNGLLCGGFWIDKYQACQPAASNVSRGGLTPDSPGSGVGAACKPHVVPWANISWNTAKTVLENRGGSGNVGSGTCANNAATDLDGVSEFLVSDITHLVGRHLELTVGGTTYYRRIIQTGKASATSAEIPKCVQFYPDLPSGVTITYATDTYRIVGHHMITAYEWFSLAAWAMKYRYQYSLGYPKGNNDYGKDIGDTRGVQVEGLADPIQPGDATHDLKRVLTGSGPATWSLNGREDGVWDLNGNIWEWVLQKVTTDGSGMVIATGYPGEGISVLPTGISGQKITALYAPDAPVSGQSMASHIFAPSALSASGVAEFGYCSAGWDLTAGTYATRKGGYWNDALNAGIWSTSDSFQPALTVTNVGIRGVF